MAEQLTGAQIIVRMLKKMNVDVIFGYPGGSIMPVFDELYKEKYNVIIVRHEQAATHAADAYYRTTGKPGVVIVTSGPGATNTVTGLATAALDSIPMICISGQVPTSMIGNDAFQEADVSGITAPITKHNYLIKDPGKIAETLNNAFYIAMTGRPGPVVIDVPKDMQTATVEYIEPGEASMRSYKPVTEGNEKQIAKAAELINEATRPLFYTGGGIIIADAEKELTEIITKTNIPITQTLLGLGGVPARIPQFIGMLGMHGTAYANYAVQECDLLIAVGARFDDRITGRMKDFAPHATIIHVDIDPANISKSVEVDIPIVGDAKNVLKMMIKHVKKRTDLDDWWARIQEYKEKHPLVYDTGSEIIKPQMVIAELSKLTDDDAIITTEVGQHQMWVAQYYDFQKPRRLCTSGGLGTMGYGFPAAVGAKIANPKQLVINIAGDGSIQMNIQEMGTIANYHIGVKNLILNNGYLGMVRQWQELFFDRRYSAVMLTHHHNQELKSVPAHRDTDALKDYLPDFMKLAEAYNVRGIRCTKQSEVIPALKEMIKDPDEPMIVEMRIAPEENVMPMVPAGAALHEMLLA